MPTPFPGMDPYLERRGLWEDVHTRLNVAMADALAPQLRPLYRVAVEQRTYLDILAPDDLIGRPDVLLIGVLEPRVAYDTAVAPLEAGTYTGELPWVDEVIERYLEIRSVPDEEVVTVIELLSHSNKSSQRGREQYEKKRLTVLASMTNLVEIDLLRAGDPMPMRIAGNGHRSHYRVVVSRYHQRPRADFHLFSVRDAIPEVSIPLRRGEPEATLPLNRVLHDLYDRAGYDLAIDYHQPAEPPLAEADAAWAAQLIARQAAVSV
jgi:hypothetical protein